MLAEGVWTASYVKLNFAALQLSHAQKQRAFGHVSPSTTTLLARKPDHSLTDSTTKETFVPPLTVKRLTWRSLDKSTSGNMIGPSERSNVCQLPSVSIKWIDVPIKCIRRLGISFTTRLHHGLEKQWTCRWKYLALAHTHTQAHTHTNTNTHTHTQTQTQTHTHTVFRLSLTRFIRLSGGHCRCLTSRSRRWELECFMHDCFTVELTGECQSVCFDWREAALPSWCNPKHGGHVSQRYRFESRRGE